MTKGTRTERERRERKAGEEGRTRRERNEGVELSSGQCQQQHYQACC
jgi:hypothetical protein